MIEAGKYTARVVDAAAGQNEKTGTDQVVVELEITESGEQQGARITYYGYLTDRAAEYTMEALENTGWSGDGFADADFADCEGHVCQIVVQHEEGQDGTTRARVRWINAPRRFSAGKPGDVAALEARLKGKLLARKSARPAQRRPAPIDEDDIGF